MVVQLAFDTTSMLGLYVVSFTPTTNIGASVDGAEITTFFAPPCTSKPTKMNLSVKMFLRTLRVCLVRRQD